jgi:metallophosphoesterase (TIGR00282 family)
MPGKGFTGLRILFLGDVVGRSGRNLICRELPRLREKLAIDFAIVNGENAAGGFGITEKIFNDFRDAGADVVTSGNHAWNQSEALVFCEREPRFLRPLNYPAGTPGKGAGLFTAANGAQVLVMNAMGRVFMEPVDDPFRAVEDEVSACSLGEGTDAIFVDFHGEASSEKMAMGHFLDGRVSAVIGTHTHVPTADGQVLTGGTAYMTDAGMCGVYDSVVGMDKEEPVRRFLTKIPAQRFSPAKGEATLCGAVVQTDDATGLARSISPLRVGGGLRGAIPDMETAIT